MNAHVPKVGLVQLGCPKNLVDSERILTQLRAEGYKIAPGYDDADVVIVNTCGFLDSAKAESLAAIGEAMEKNGRVIVTGCYGIEADTIRQCWPSPARTNMSKWWPQSTKRCRQNMIRDMIWCRRRACI
jgi:ribosomal protein S12 methylthiotransferase